MTGASLLLLFSVLQHAQGASPAMPPTTKGERESGLGFHAVLEAGGLVLPSGVPAGELEGLDGFAVLYPRLEVDGGKEFLFVLGAPLRLRLLDQAPLQQVGDLGGVLRREDWDERSDFGQVLQRLRIAPSDSFRLEAGGIYGYTLGEGHLVNRYNNQLMPDYHPAGAQLSAALGAARVDLFASDVLATRLFAGQIRLDLGKLTGSAKEDAKPAAPAQAKPAAPAQAQPAAPAQAKPAASADAKPAAPAPAKPAASADAKPATPAQAKPAASADAKPAAKVESQAAAAPEASKKEDDEAERHLATLAVAYDLGRGGGLTPAMGAANLGAQTALYKVGRQGVWVMINGGARLGQPQLEAGGAFGLRGVAAGEGWRLRGQVEGRYQGGGFRFGMFGAGYELARFAGVGLSAPPLAEERIPMAPSGAGELALSLGSPSKVDGLMLHVSVAGEYFTFGRVDADLAAELRLPGGNTTGSLRIILTGLQVDPRYAAMLQVRHRLAPWLFAWGSGGVVHFAQAEGGLVRGYTGGLGVGVDFER